MLWLAALGVAAGLLTSTRRGAFERGTLLLTILAAVFLAALVWPSPPRTVGDGVEYISMARQLGAGRWPSLSAPQVIEAEQFIGEGAGVAGVDLGRPALVGADGRQDFHHFWLYPLLVAPALRVAEMSGAHPVYAFTITNVVLLLCAFVFVTSRCGASIGVLVLFGPLVWWVDKPHSEVLIVSALAVALAGYSSAPALALPALGVATGQNPALAPVLVGVTALVLAAHAKRTIAWLSAAIGAGIALLHPLYYWSHLGVWSPLAGVTLRDAPGRTALFTPLLDLNLGIAFAAPALALAVIAGTIAIVRRGFFADWPIFGVLTAMGLPLLLLFAQSGNVNSGGTFGPTRYGLWLMPLAIPLLALRREGGHRHIQAGLACLGLAGAILLAHPRLPDEPFRHTRLASWIFAHWARMYSPLPEVFAERSRGRDGWRSLPVASGACEKVLVMGEGTADGRWPMPCQPARLPPGCADLGAICYASRTGVGYGFTRAPGQAGFDARIDALTSWTAEERTLWTAVVGPYESELVVHRAGTADSLIVDIDGVDDIHALQSPRRLVAWVTPRSGQAARVRLSLGTEAEVEVYDPVPRPVRLLRPSERMTGQPWLALPESVTLLVISLR